VDVESDETREDGDLADGRPPPDIDLVHIRSRAKKLLDLTPEEPVRVGRFTVVERIGMGGMGVVYLAYDPELDRRVALKMLRPDSAVDSDDAARARLLREAQAMAKLSHPNVIAVFDVGETRDRVYMAVEYVEGGTLRRWLKDTRTWREILEVFVQAGRGLAAAHAAGLVHRDFKPSNVLVGLDDRVRVLDFGLARTSMEPQETAPANRDADPPSIESALDDPITEVGTVLGTPAYMSPEQHRGQPAASASDQFSFCVTLYEAVYGARPFGNEGVGRSETARSPEPPTSQRVPARIRRAILRGLSIDPEARWASMDDLLSELDTARRPRWPWLVTGAAVIAVAAAFAISPGGEPDACGDPDQKLSGVWDADRKVAIERAFEDTGVPYAAHAWTSVEGAMDDRARAWTDAYRESCDAAKDGSEAEDVHLERTLCLEWQLQEMGALAAVFVHVDRDVLEHAATAVEDLTPLDQCSPDQLGRRQVRPPTDPNVREEVQAIRLALTEVDALRRAGKYDPALQTALPLQERAKALGYRPLDAETQTAVGKLQMLVGDYEGAEATLLAAIESAEAASHDRIAARAWTHLVDVIGTQQARLDEARKLTSVARGAVQRLQGDTLAEAELLRIEGEVAQRQAKFAESIELLTRALELMEAKLGPMHASTADVRIGLAIACRDDDQVDKALAHAAAAQEIIERTRGAGHPELAASLTTTATIRRGLGADQPTLELFKRALAINEAALGPEHPRVAGDLHNVGSTLRERGEFEKALPYLERTLAIDEKTSGDDEARVAPSEYELGMLLLQLGRLDEARPHMERSLRLAESSVGRDHPNLAYPLIGLATIDYQIGEKQAARDRFERALSILSARVGESHVRYSMTLIDFGQAAVRSDDAELGLEKLELAFAKLPDVHLSSEYDVRLRFALAQALGVVGREHGRATGLAQDALTRAKGDRPAEDELRAEIQLWLKEHNKQK
jgi:tetratricopeptide (TPR) repeat protein